MLEKIRLAFVIIVGIVSLVLVEFQLFPVLDGLREKTFDLPIKVADIEQYILYMLFAFFILIHFFTLCYVGAYIYWTDPEEYIDNCSKYFGYEFLAISYIFAPVAVWWMSFSAIPWVYLFINAATFLLGCRRRDKYLGANVSYKLASIFINIKTVIFAICSAVLIGLFYIGVVFLSTHVYSAFSLFITYLLLTVALCAIGIILFTYTLWPLVFKYNVEKTKYYRSNKKNKKTEDIKENIAITRRWCFLTVLLASFYAWAVWYAGESYQWMIFCLVVWIWTGFTEGALKWAVFVGVPLLFAFMGWWCHFDEIGVIGVVMLIVHFVARILFYYACGLDFEDIFDEIFDR